MRLDPFCTYLPVLLSLVGRGQGPVLEIGGGLYSTPCLHAICHGRRLITLETNPQVHRVLRFMETKWHSIAFGKSYDDFDAIIRRTPWEIAFVDHAPENRRNIELLKLGHARYVVVHDTEHPGYSYHLSFPSFANSRTFKRFKPWTTILSNSSLDDLSPAIDAFQ